MAKVKCKICGKVLDEVYAFDHIYEHWKRGELPEISSSFELQLKYWDYFIFLVE